MFVYLADLLNWEAWIKTSYFRGFGAFAVALLVSLVVGGKFIEFLRKRQKKGQPIREDGPQSHLLTKKELRQWGGR